MTFLRKVRLLLAGVAVLLLMAASTVPVRAVDGSQGSATATFLKMDPYAGSASMGSGHLGRSGVEATFFNPGGLGFLTTTQTSVTQNNIFADITYRNLSVAFPTEYPNGGLGVAVTALDYGDQDRTQVSNGNPVTDGLGEFGASDMAFSTTYGMQLNESFAIGAGLKYVETDIAGFQGGTLSGDLGAQFRTFVPGLTVGLAGRNLFGEIQLNKRPDPLPRVYEIGGNYRFALVPGRHEIGLAWGGGVPSDADGYVFGGVEYGLYRTAAIRFGHRTAQEAGDGFTMGAGLDYAGVSVDYAYVPFGELGRQQRFSFAFEFGGVPGRKAEKRTEPSRERMGEPSRAEPDREVTPEWPERLRRARQLHRAGSTRRAYGILRDLHRQHPDNVDVLLWLGLVEYELGDRSAAVERMRRVLEIDPDNQYARDNLEKLGVRSE